MLGQEPATEWKGGFFFASELYLHLNLGICMAGASPLRWVA